VPGHGPETLSANNHGVDSSAEKRADIIITCVLIVGYVGRVAVTDAAIDTYSNTELCRIPPCHAGSVVIIC
jgi:hypothetical protein